MFTLHFGHLPNPNLFEFKMFCLFDFSPFPEYVEEIYQTCTMHETLERAHATFYANAQRIGETEFAER